MWQIRKVYVAQILPYGDNAVAYVGENWERANEIVKRLRTDIPITCDERGVYRPHVQEWMVAVRFENGKRVEIQGLAKCENFGPHNPSPFSRAEFDIAPEGL
jgi:hypothetical protein